MRLTHHRVQPMDSSSLIPTFIRATLRWLQTRLVIGKRQKKTPISSYCVAISLNCGRYNLGYYWPFLLLLSSRMRVMNHRPNWSARKQRLHLQSVAGISRHSALSEDRIRQCGTSSGSLRNDTDQCSVSRHFLLRAPQCLCSVRKRFNRDHCC